MRRPLIVSLLALAQLVLSCFVVAQRTCGKQFVVSQVSLPPQTTLSQSHQARIRSQLIGLCFDGSELANLTASVSYSLQNMGYLRATVSLPSFATCAGWRAAPSCCFSC